MLIPSAQAQTSPWQLFGQICQFTSPNSPQCQQLLLQQQLTAAQQQQLQQQQAFIPFIPTTPFQTIPTIISLPIANAGGSQTVHSGASVILNGAGSTGSVSILNGVQTQANIISYAWTQLSGTTVLLNAANTVTPTFTAPIITNTTTILSFSLTVTDSIGQVSAPATTFVSVTSP
ncbi:MAG: hypothetical protein M3044_00890 [Thermoproteota archaeon]|nr:hypothetical protein [Thermoproteota archaeon]